jgi:hypothetical protein
MCTLFDLSPEDLFYKWEAFSYSGSVKDRMISTLTIDGAKELHAYLRQQRAAQAAVSTPAMPKVKTLPKSVLRGFGGTPKMSPSPFRTPQPMKTRIARVPDTPTIVAHRPKAQYIPPTNLSEYKCTQAAPRIFRSFLYNISNVRLVYAGKDTGEIRRYGGFISAGSWG